MTIHHHHKLLTFWRYFFLSHQTLHVSFQTKLHWILHCIFSGAFLWFKYPKLEFLQQGNDLLFDWWKLNYILICCSVNKVDCPIFSPNEPTMQKFPEISNKLIGLWFFSEFLSSFLCTGTTSVFFPTIWKCSFLQQCCKYKFQRVGYRFNHPIWQIIPTIWFI